MAKRPEKSKEDGDEAYFSSERMKFEAVVKHALLVGNKIGRQITDERRGMASWLFMRACITSHTIVRLFEPQPSGFGDASYLDHTSIAGLSRGLIENIAVILYVGDVDLSEDQWRCRKHIIDLHDYLNRSAFLKAINYQSGSQSNEKAYDFLKERVVENPYFKTLPMGRQKRLLGGDDMFIDGRHTTMLKLGWGEDLTRGVYKYLSNQTHSLPMAFHRTIMNDLYEKDSTSAKVTAAFSVEFARRALGTGCLRMIALFPYIEAVFDPLIFHALKSQYTPGTLSPETV